MATRERSPNYPVHSLEAAIGFARSIYSKEKMGPATPDILARHIGHEGLTGPSRGKIASLRQYGLLEAKGDDLALSRLAFTILHSPDEDERKTALAEAALKPPLFAELRTEKPDASDETLKYYLRSAKKFSDEGAKRAVKAFRETSTFALFPSMSYNADEPPGSNDLGSEENTLDPNAGNKPEKRSPSLDRKPEKQSVSYTWPLPNGTDVQITFERRPDAESVDALINYLNVVKPVVAERAAEPAPSLYPEVDDGVV